MQAKSSTPVAWIAAAIRLMAVWYALDVLIAMPSLIMTLRTEADPRFRWGLYGDVVNAIGILVVAAALWSTSEGLAARVWREPNGVASEAPQMTDVKQAFFAALGLYFIVTGLPRIATIAYRYYTLPQRFGLTDEFQWSLVTGAIGGTIAVV
jgi:hypothetical protein